jgi:hypothetical protein
MKLFLQRYGQYLLNSNGSGKLGENDAEEAKEQNLAFFGPLKQ